MKRYDSRGWPLAVKGEDCRGLRERGRGTVIGVRKCAERVGLVRRRMRCFMVDDLESGGRRGRCWSIVL